MKNTRKLKTISSIKYGVEVDTQRFVSIISGEIIEYDEKDRLVAAKGEVIFYEYNNIESISSRPELRFKVRR